MDLGPITITRKSGDEKLYSARGNIEIRLLDFWRWAASDLLSNSTRGKLAEFIVATDLGIADNVRNEWDAYDLTTKDGTKIEIKTSAYLQSWHQDKLSAISFDIKPTIKWNSQTNKFEGESKRQSDFYIFCLLHHTDKTTVDPMNTDQWTFYVLSTKKLNQLSGQKRISLPRLLKMDPIQCGYGQIIEALKKYKP